MRIDVRDNGIDNVITEIVFDCTGDYLIKRDNVIKLVGEAKYSTNLCSCTKRDIDNLIKALKVARDNWT